MSKKSKKLLIPNTLSEPQIEAHLYATRKIDQIMADAFSFIRKEINDRGEVFEYDVQQFILARFKKENLLGGRPIVAAGENSRFPHYTPTAQKKNDLIKEGSAVLIDMWVRKKGRNGIYADITWVGYVKQNKWCQTQEVKFSMKEYKDIFKIVTDARNKAIIFIKQRLKIGKSVEGWEVDDVVRKYINNAGYGKFFIHSTGHSLDKNVHGQGVSLSSVKRRGYKLARKKDRRKILQNAPFTIEPGIYLENFGIRSEIDAYVDQKNELIVTTNLQKEIAII